MGQRTISGGVVLGGYPILCLRDVNINDSAVEKFVLGRDYSIQN